MKSLLAEKITFCLRKNLLSQKEKIFLWIFHKLLLLKY